MGTGKEYRPSASRDLSGRLIEDVKRRDALPMSQKCVSPTDTDPYRHRQSCESAIYGLSALPAPGCRAGCRALWRLRIPRVPPDSICSSSR